MSETTIDERVVEMRFDNKQFESGAKESISTLEKLKRSLNLTGASKGLEDVGAAAKNVNLSGLGNSIDAIQAKFSAMQVIGVTALANLTNSAINAGKRIASALTITPVKTGFQEYETQINAVQTILANTQSKGTTLNDVNNALDTLNTYADKTIYNFTEMTRNIGTFTAAGIDLDTSVNAIQGIANLAAVSGSTSQQASTAMYQLSQALASGTVKLMDWNSVVNAGMGGQVFQDALKETARVHGIAIDSMIKEEGSFRETLSKGWLTSEILTETLQKFTLTTEGLTDAQIEQNREMLRSKGYTDEQIDAIFELGNTATNAATKVKTFTQLWDTLKEAAQSGWTQTWEIVVGDFEEAKALLSEVSNVIGEMIGKSAEARNSMLQGWKDLGGRTALIDAVRNAFEGVMNVVKPIKEAFREIFPPTTSEQLYNLTVGLKNLTERFKEFTSANGEKIKSTFRGIFSAVDIGVEVINSVVKGISSLIENFSGIENGILGATASAGDWITNLRDSIKETDIFGESVEKVTGFISKVIDKLKEFGSSARDVFKSPEYEGFVGFLKGIWHIVTLIGSKVGSAFSSIGTGLANAFGDTNFFNVLNSGLFSGILIGITKFVNSLSDPIKEVSGILENAKGILDDVRGCFEAYQNQLKAGTLLKIAGAIGILAAAIFVISTIDPVALDQSLGAITILFAELMGSMAIFSKLSGGTKGVFKMSAIMISLSLSLLILSGAMKALSTIDGVGIAKGLIAIGVLMTELAIFLNTAKFGGKTTRTAIGIVVLSSAMLILAKAVKNFGSMEWGEIGKGLVAIGGLLAELSLFSKLTGNAKHVISTGLSMILLGASMKIFASAMKDFSGMEWGEIGKGLLAMGGALSELTLALNLMPSKTILIGPGLIAVAAATKILASAMRDFGGMKWEEIGRGLVAMGGALGEVAIALNLMRGTISGSAALIVAAGALAIIAPVLKLFGNMSWTEIAKGLITLGGAFAIIGIAGLLLTPLVPTILSLAAAFAIFGISTLAIGAGLSLIGVGLTVMATGFTALATAGAAGATAIVAALTIIITGLANLIPMIAKKIGEGVVAFATVIGECAPQLADAALKLIVAVMESLSTYVPQFADYLMKFLIGILDAVADNLPQLISSAMNVIGAFFEGVVDALSGIDVTNLIKGIVGVGLLSGLMLALSAVAGLVPGAMLGVIGMGAVIAELAIVLAAIGAFAQIPGLSWLIEEGGQFLETIGNAIGKFVGGIAGGFAEGVSSSFPAIGSDLSAFMTNLKPFLDGAKTIDSSMSEGAKALADTILTLTAADILDGIFSFITGGSSLTKFAEQIVPFGEAMKGYSDAVSGIDSGAVVASATAAKALSELSSNLPNSGGLVSFFTGDNELSDFAEQLIPFGKAMKQYSDAVVGIDSAAVEASATAGKALSKLAESLPNSGGVAGFFAGNNDMGDFAEELVPFGKAMKQYSDAVSGLDCTAITDSTVMVKRLVSMFNGMSGLDTSGVNLFKRALNTLVETNMNDIAKSFRGSDTEFMSAGRNMTNSLIKGMESKFSSLTTTMSKMMNGMMESLSSKINLFVRAGSSVLEAIARGITNQRMRISTAMLSALNLAVMSARGYYSNFYNAGAYLVSGFANGISANSYKAAAQARAMAASAASAARRELNEHSPSRVFYDIGDFAGLGFVNALRDYGDKSYRAGSEMASSAREGLRRAIDQIKDTMNGNLDTQPTIRPVIDLTDVTSGVGAIQGMLDLNPSLGIMSNIRSIGTMMNSRQNGINGELASAIKDLKSVLGGGRGNVYNINGITYDDGSNIRDAVETLVRAAKRERRV